MTFIHNSSGVTGTTWTRNISKQRIESKGKKKKQKKKLEKHKVRERWRRSLREVCVGESSGGRGGTTAVDWPEFLPGCLLSRGGRSSRWAQAERETECASIFTFPPVTKTVREWESRAAATRGAYGHMSRLLNQQQSSCVRFALITWRLTVTSAFLFWGKWSIFQKPTHTHIQV